MEESYVGQQVVGLDLHRRRTVMVRMTPAGERLEAVRFASDPAVLAEQIVKAGPAPEVVAEATYGWYWVADVLGAAGARLHLAHPLGVKGFAYRRVKNDFRDAADLADLRLVQLHQVAALVDHLAGELRVRVGDQPHHRHHRHALAGA